MGVKLLHRNKQRLHLSPAGELLRVARLMVSLLGRSEQAFAWASPLAAVGLVAGNCGLLFLGARPSGEPDQA